MMYVCYADSDELRDPVLFESAFREMSAERQKKIETLRRDCDRRLSLAAGILCQHALDLAGIPESERTWARSEKGKPFLKDHPDIHFNLSHSGARAVCAVADVPLGVDVQAFRKVSEGLSSRFYSESEQRLLAAAGSETERSRTFFRLWTLKESFLKALGIGISVPLSSISFSWEAGHVSVAQKVTDRPHVFFEWEEEGYRYALCLETDKTDSAPLWHKISLARDARNGHFSV